MPKKEKIVPILIHSREALESVVADVVALKLQQAQLTAAMEAEIAAVQKRHQEGILSVARQIEIKEAGVHVYCESHRAELFPEKKKSIETLLAVIGFRTNPPSVKTIKAKDKLSEIAKRLLCTTWGAEYVTDPEPEVSKETILRDRDKLTAEQLRLVGLRIDQEENFFIEPKSQIAETTVRAAA